MLVIEMLSLASLLEIYWTTGIYSKEPAHEKSQ
jgi:hypothetical protein